MMYIDTLGSKVLSLGQVLVAHACNPSNTGGSDQDDQGSRPAQTNSSQDPISKIPNRKKRAGGVDQEVEHLPSKCEILSSNPSIKKKKKEKEKKVLLIGSLACGMEATIVESNGSP
jgi:hypothetical protein